MVVEIESLTRVIVRDEARRLDAIEFIEVCEALSLDPADAFRDLLDRRALSKGRGRKMGKGG